MEHLKFFELASDPFQNESDEKFYFESAPQKRARMRVLRGIHQGKTLTVVVGGPGLGKTTLAHHALAGLDPKRYDAHLLSIPHESCASGWFMPQVARAFGVRVPSASIPELVQQIQARLVMLVGSGRTPVLFVDEAQLFRNREAMEEFRGLLNLVHDGRKLVSLVLFGLTDLDEVLALDAPLAQRVEVRVQMSAMDFAESKAYLAHRLAKAGVAHNPFDGSALEVLYRYSGGAPRVLNTLADNALFEAFLSETHTVDGSIVDEAAQGLALKPVAEPSHARGMAEWVEPLAMMPGDTPDLTPHPSRKPPTIDEYPDPPTRAPVLEHTPAFVANPEPEEEIELAALKEAPVETVFGEETTPELRVNLDADWEDKADAKRAIARLEDSQSFEKDPIAEFELEEVVAEPEEEPAEAVTQLAPQRLDEPDDASLDAIEIELEEAAATIGREPEEEPELAALVSDSDSFSLSSVVDEVEAEDAAELVALKAKSGNDSGFDLGSVLEEVEFEELPAVPPKAAAKPAPKPERDEDDVDSMFDEIKLAD